MNMIYCENCHQYIDTDYDAEHEEECEDEEEEHKCWKIEKGKQPNPNHYRFIGLKKISRFHFREIWRCWECNKVVERRIPFLKSINFEKTKYWKAQKC